MVRKDRLTAFRMRMLGKSYNEINRDLGISKATLSGWFTGLELPEQAKQRIQKRVQEKSLAGLLKRNAQQTINAERQARLIRQEAKRSLAKISEKELLMIGVALYWAEGYKRPIVRNGRIKTSHPVRLTNSDPNLVKIYLRFLREVCKVPEEKISANVRIFEHQNEGYLLDFWAKQTQIAPSRFQKFYYGVSKSSKGVRPFNILPYGTIQISVNDTKLYHKIMGWIDGMI